MNKKSDIFYSKNYLILNFLILCGYLLPYQFITNKLELALFGVYIVANSNLGINFE